MEAIRPNDFDFNANRGKSVKITKTDNSIKTGTLLGIMPDDVVVLEFEAKNGLLGLSEIDYSEIREVLVNVDHKSKQEFNGYFLRPKQRSVKSMRQQIS